MLKPTNDIMNIKYKILCAVKIVARIESDFMFKVDSRSFIKSIS